MLNGDMKHDFEIELPSYDDDSESVDCVGDKLVIIPITKYEYLTSELGKLDALKSYLRLVKKPSITSVGALLGVEIEGRTHD